MFSDILITIGALFGLVFLFFGLFLNFLNDIDNPFDSFFKNPKENLKLTEQILKFLEIYKKDIYKYEEKKLQLENFLDFLENDSVTEVYEFFNEYQDLFITLYEDFEELEVKKTKRFKTNLNNIKKVFTSLNKAVKRDNFNQTLYENLSTNKFSSKIFNYLLKNRNKLISLELKIKNKFSSK